MTIKLDKPIIKPGLLKDIQNRKSHRDFSPRSLDKNQISLILWAAGGKKVDAVTSASRTVPSAGARYPIELFLLVGEEAVKGIQAGFYHYSVENHSLELIFLGDKRKDVTIASLGQEHIQNAPVALVIAVDYKRTTSRYGSQRGIRYAHMDVGHACENVYLIVADLGLGTVEIGAFSDEDIKNVLHLAKNLQPLAIMPIGYTNK
ncbi:MAG: SagB/ThcOx family dehydrogenase [Candidatus Omnitrophota bacterium]